MEERQDLVLRLLLQRDEQGMRELFTHYSGALLAIIDPIVKDPGISEEVLHDVLLKVWENVEAYDAGKSRLFTWMARIARNAAIDKVRSKEYRDRSKTEAIPDVVANDGRLSETPTMEYIGVPKLLQHLDDEHRAIIDLLFLKDFTQSEAADELDIPLGTVKTRSRRALQQLRKFLQSEMIWLAILLHNLIKDFYL